MTKYFLVPIALALAAYVLLPLPGQSVPLSERIEDKRSQIAKKKHTEGLLTETINGYNSRIRGLQGEIGSTQRRLGTVQSDLDDKRAELLEVRERLEISRDKLARARPTLSRRK